MMLKTFKGGLTYQGARVTMAYLIDDRLSLGTSRVLFGDSEITLSFIKEASKKQKWPWSSGVLSFSEILDEKIKREIISDFERVFFVAFSRKQYNIIWINHEDKGRTELHYIAPRLELSTGKSFNPYFVHRDFNKKDLWQEKINLQYGFTSHFDKLKATSEKRANWAKDKKSLLKQIDEMIIPLIKEDTIKSRNDIIDKLREDFELRSIERGFLEVIDDSGNIHSLKGAIYSQDFTDFQSLYNTVQEKKKVTANGTPRELEAIKKSLNEIVQKQTYGNRQTYGISIDAKSSQIDSLIPRLEPIPYKKVISENRDATHTKSFEEVKNNKKEETNDRLRAKINRFFERSRGQARRRTKRIYDSIRTSRELSEDIELAADQNYRVVRESLENWRRKKRYREDFKILFLGIEQLTQQFELIFTRRDREVERRFTERNTEIERSFSERNTAITELIQNRINPEEKLVQEQRVKNAVKRVMNNANKVVSKLTLYKK